MAETIKKSIVILYHADCPDGFGAAWAAWKKFGSRADYIPVEHHKPPPPGLTRKEIFIVDFSYSLPILKKLANANKKVIIIDHHISAQKTVEQFPNLFALNHSGAALSWNYFHPKKKTPRLLRYIEDVDLWRFRIPKTREVIAFLGLHPFDFLLWDRFAKGFEKKKERSAWIQMGEAALRYEMRLVERIVKKAKFVRFLGIKTYAVNSPVLQSDLGHALVKKFPPLGIVWSEKGGMLRVSLRSDGKLDVSKLAVRFGGGGHKAAAGFSIPLKNGFPWKETKR